MPDRMIRVSAVDSPSLNRCSLGAYLAWPWLAMMADSHGRLCADATSVRVALCKRRSDVTDADVQVWLDEWEREGMLRRWNVGERVYGEIVSFASHQRIRYVSRASAIPEPDGPVHIIADEASQSKEHPVDTSERRLPREVVDALAQRFPLGAPSDITRKCVGWMFVGDDRFTAAEVRDAIAGSTTARNPVAYIEGTLRNMARERNDKKPAAKSVERVPEYLPTMEESLNG